MRRIQKNLKKRELNSSLILISNRHLLLSVDINIVNYESFECETTNSKVTKQVIKRRRDFFLLDMNIFYKRSSSSLTNNEKNDISLIEEHNKRMKRKLGNELLNSRFAKQRELDNIDWDSIDALDQLLLGLELDEDAISKFESLSTIEGRHYLRLHEELESLVALSITIQIKKSTISFTKQKIN